jgi:hypothetical protein
MKHIVRYLGIFILGSFGGWFLYDLLLSLFSIERANLIFTNLSDLYFLKLKVVGLFGLMSVAIALGTIAPKTLNGVQRFLIITVPTIATCVIVLAARRALIAKILEMPNFVNQPALAVRSLKIEFVPFSGLLMAIVIISILFKRSGQQ